jgi:hypothetical protein
MGDAMSRDLLDAEQLRLRQAHLKRRYRDWYGQLEKLFSDHDPIGIGVVPDEYDPEVELLLPEIDRVTDVDELTDRIHAIFQRMFSADIAGPRRKYEPIARDVWRMLKESKDGARRAAGNR